MSWTARRFVGVTKRADREKEHVKTVKNRGGRRKRRAQVNSFCWIPYPIVECKDPHNRFVVRKQLFPTKEAADLSLTSFAVAHPKKGHKPIRSYKCDYCGGYHVTSQPLKRGSEQRSEP